MEPTTSGKMQPQKVEYRNFLLRDSSYQRLNSLQLKGWSLSEGDAHFRNRQLKSLSLNEKIRHKLFKMMQKIAENMDDETSAFSFASPSPNALDLCMAPGGFLAHFLSRYKGGVADAITLSEVDGGHQILLSVEHQRRAQVTQADITMFSGVFGVCNIPKDHPEAQKFVLDWPYAKKTYDLVICDGQTLRTQDLAEYRQDHEQSRLFNSQLTLALKSVRPGGTIIALLHRLHKWRTFNLLKIFDKFSDIQLFKHRTFHAQKSSFYLIAKNVQPHSQEAVEAMESFRQRWIQNTFPADVDRNEEYDDGNDDGTQVELGAFEARFFELARPLWDIQATALENANWMKGVNRKDPICLDCE